MAFALTSMAQPVITSFSPRTGAIGTSVTITGNNFNSTPANNIVYFGAVQANVTAASPTLLTVTVPAGANFAPVTVTTNNLTAYSAQPFIVTFSGGSLFDYSSFGDIVEPETGVKPYGVTVSDIDGDGKADITVANSGIRFSTVSVLRNTSTAGSISFAAKKDYNDIPDFPYAIASGDLDGDGKQDIVVSYISDDGDVAIYKNNSTPGTVSLTQVANYPTGINPYKVIIADIDLDGKPDIITANYLSSSVSILRNTSTGGVISFAPKTDFNTGLGAYSVTVADFDGDGKPDLASTNDLSNTFSVMRNTSTAGSVSFAARQDFPSGGNPYGITAGDLDGDGKPEIALVNHSDLTASVMRNTSTTGVISFAPRQNYALNGSTPGPYDIHINDIDGDGKPELTMTGPTSLVSVLKNASTAGTILFTSVYFYTTPSPFMIANGDFDADGKTDLAVSNFIGTTVTVLRNRANEPHIVSFTPTEAFSGESVTISGNNLAGATAVSFGGVAAASFTVVDKNTITAVVGSGASGEVKVTTPTGVARLDGFTLVAPPTITNFTPKFSGAGATITITGTSFKNVTGVSFGGTPAESFIVVSYTSISAVVGAGSSGDVEVTTLYGTTAKPGYTFYPKPSIISFTPASGGTGTNITITGTDFTGATAVSVGGVAASSFTVNSSTSITAVVAEGGSGSITVTTPGGKDTSDTYFSFPPPTITSFTPASGVPGSNVTITGTNFRSVSAANTVYFGAVKATVLAAGNNSLTVRVPDGATFVPLTVTVNNHTAFAAKPFNTTFPDAGAGINAGSFGWKRGPKTDAETRKIIIQDIDGDGRPDMVYHNANGTISVFRHTNTTGTFGFSNYVDVVTGLGTGNIPLAVGDVNGDGKPDIVIANHGTEIMVYRNTSTSGNISFADKVAFVAQSESRGLVIADIDGDARADIINAGADFPSANPKIAVYRNIGYGDVLEFDAPAYFNPGIFLFGIHVADFDGDGKPDIAGNSASNTGVVSVLRNTSTSGTISFEGYMHLPTGNGSFEMAVADFNGDNKPDIVTSNYYDSSFYIVKNNSTPGNLSFAGAVPTLLHKAINHIITGQLDGDGKPDIVVVDETSSQLALFRNTSTAAVISFAPRVDAIPKQTYNYIRQTYIGDLDGDQKPDIVVTHAADPYLSIFRNQSAENFITVCSGTDTTLTVGIGTVYQWQVQVNSTSSYTNISNTTQYSGANSASLHLTSIPASWNGYQFRCIIDGTTGTVHNMTVNASKTITATASSPAQACGNTAFSVTYTSSNTPAGSTIELWESDNGGAFIKTATQTFSSSPFKFDVTVNSSVTKKYFFMVTPAATATCTLPVKSDTAQTVVSFLAAPAFTASGYTLTITSPDGTVAYTWQYQSNGVWSDVVPASTGNSHKVIVPGNYRLKAVRGNCTAYSAAQTIISTGINPVTPQSAGISVYPNPASAEIIIDTLRLSDKWQTLDIYHTNGRKVISGYAIGNQSVVRLAVHQLSPGVYFAVLRRKSGAPVMIKFIKE